MIRQALAIILAFIGGFVVVGGFVWAPRISSAMSSLVSTGPSASMFADTSRIGRADVAPVLKHCIFRVVDVGPEADKLQPSAGYFILKAGTMQANFQSLAGKPNARMESRTVLLATKWAELAECIYAKDDRELCDADNRAAMVESTAKFFAFAKQLDGIQPPLPADEARVIENSRGRLLAALKNHRRYGTLTAGDFGSFAPAEIQQVMRADGETRDICKR
jgi:hypothetical protein